jgi:serine/threonine protein kinase/tetratricopeptide (TPR) repeat protein
MKPERWKQIDDLLEAALVRPAGERAAFLDQACAGDEALRRELELLLRADREAGSFIEAPAVEAAADLLAESRSHLVAGQRVAHYTIVSRIGAGGMGEVYLAEDGRLRRRVALKLLPIAFSQDEERVRRFEQEARAAAKLSHPNACTIHEVGRAEDGRHFIAMEYVEGETLRQRLARGPVGVRETLEIGQQMARALAAAHEAGIVHRDIKPENIVLRPDGYAKVLDFGLAKLTERPDRDVGDPEVSTLTYQTASGVVMGTAAYMSPEQARGLSVDTRTDIWSLGVVLYETLAGRVPFTGETVTDMLVAIVEKEPPPLTSLAIEAIPAELDWIIAKTSCKDRTERYQTSKELLVDLQRLRQRLEIESHLGRSTEPETSGAAAKTGEQATTRWTARLPGAFSTRRARIVAAVLAALLLSAIAYVQSWRRTPVTRHPEIKSLAVLPLENLSGDPAQEYFADGMTEALISNLAQVRALRVISRTSVMRFKGSRKPLPEIARELNVDAMIEGSVQRAGGRVKISARLIDAVNDSPLRSFDYERELADVLKLQSEVARAVAHEIDIQVTAEERARLAAARSVNPSAYEAHLLGHYHQQRLNEENLKLAISHFERATQLDAEYAAAWAGLSSAWVNRGIWGAKSFREVEQLARTAAIKALELDAGSAEANTALAGLKIMYDLDWAGAEQGYKRAIALDPSYTEAHELFAYLLSALGRHSEAISEIQIAERLDPLSPSIQSTYGRVLYRARNYEEAEQRLKRASELEPQLYGAYSRLVDVYLQMEEYEKAIASLEKLRELGGDTGSDRSVFDTAKLARVYAQTGRRDEARRILRGLQRTTEPARFHKIGVAAAWAALGDNDEAFRLLFSVVEERTFLSMFINADPPFDSLHSDPRWKALLRRMNFPGE